MGKDIPFGTLVVANKIDDIGGIIIGRICNANKGYFNEYLIRVERVKKSRPSSPKFSGWIPNDELYKCNHKEYCPDRSKPHWYVHKSCVRVVMPMYLEYLLKATESG